VGYVEKIPAAGGEHAIIRQRRVETLATQLANTQEDVLSPNKAKRSEVASSKFERAPRAESLPAPKNFFAKTSFTQRLPPLMGQNHFWTGFCQRGHD
jgi:hypothetical protein